MINSAKTLLLACLVLISSVQAQEKSEVNIDLGSAEQSARIAIPTEPVITGRFQFHLEDIETAQLEGFTNRILQCQVIVNDVQINLATYLFFVNAFSANSGDQLNIPKEFTDVNDIIAADSNLLVQLSVALRDEVISRDILSAPQFKILMGSIQEQYFSRQASFRINTVHSGRYFIDGLAELVECRKFVIAQIKPRLWENPHVG